MPLPKIISTVEAEIVEQGMNGSGGSTVPNALYYLVRTGDTLPPWWSRSRDIALHDVYVSNNHLAGLVNLATTKLVNIPLTFVPRDPTISSHVDVANEFTLMMNLGSEFGRGIRRALKKFITDFLVFDNGGFLEVLGDGPKDGPIRGAVRGVRHLDSLACTRTGDLEYPVVYRLRGVEYKFHWTRVIELAQNMSGRDGKNEVGLSAISRSIELGQVLKDQLTYKLEKMGSRPANQLIVGKNMEATTIIKSFMMAEELMDSLGLERYAKVVALGGADVEVDKIDLNNFEPFDEEMGTLMAIYALAYIWGLDVRDIWPGASSGSKGDQIANMKARGRLPADYTGDLGDQLELKVCPPFLKPVFDFKDDEEDQMRSVNADIRSRRYQRMAENGVLDKTAMQRMMVVDGDLSREEFVRLQLDSGKLEDGSPIGSLFFSDDPIIMALCTLEGIPEPLVYEDNNPTDIFREVSRQRSLAMQLLAGTRSVSQRRKAMEAIAALDWLEKEYKARAFMPQDEEEQQPDDIEETEEQENEASEDDTVDSQPPDDPVEEVDESDPGVGEMDETDEA